MLYMRCSSCLGQFFILSFVKTTQKIPLSDTSDIQQAILCMLLSRRYDKFIPGPVRTKFHALEGYLLDFSQNSAVVDHILK